MSDHDSNPSQTMTLTACPVGLVDHDSNPSQTMTLTACPVGATWVLALRAKTQVAWEHYLGLRPIPPWGPYGPSNWGFAPIRL